LKYQTNKQKLYQLIQSEAQQVIRRSLVNCHPHCIIKF